MASNFPTSLDNFFNPVSGDRLDNPSHSTQHSDANDAIEALETKIGIGASPAGSAIAGYAFVHSSGGTTGWSQVGYQGITSGTASLGETLMSDGSGSSVWATAGAAFKNLVINGAMQVAQRATSVTGITASGYYTADRWTMGISSMGTWTQTLENDAPTGSGFRKSVKVLCTTADASPAASDQVNITQLIEGQNLQSLRKGTANAQQLTVSFWVKSNVTGTYIVWIFDTDNNRQVSATYTIATSGTWEKKTIVFPADTTGVLDNDNAESLRLRFYLGVGSNFTSGTLATSWESGTGNTGNIAVGQTNLAAATDNYWQITGVQLEVGSSATGFEFLPAQTELALCQRYYYRNNATSSYSFFGLGTCSSTTAIQPLINLPVTMRANPSSVDYSTLAVYDHSGAGVNAVTNLVLEGTSTLNTVGLSVTVASGLTQTRTARLAANNSTSAYIGFNSEL
jgi:hypothetical protein